ncbi:MAG TPA: acetoacetate--CoA ligase [Solirubrobacteraceae bacterium]|jgi:acetoacetyl-CoA synthetase|nr:acetoacetate--CoA ligase [Solirubrobacteraceae bacterium]
MTTTGEVLWEPTAEQARASGVGRYMAWLADRHGLRFEDYAALHHWSVTELEAFWASVWEYCDVEASRPYEEVLSTHAMPAARWFTGSELNFAEHMLRRGQAGKPSVIFVREGEDPVEIDGPALTAQVAALAAGLRERGVGPGDIVAGYLPNVPETLIAFLACASIGAIWSTSAPDFGTQSVIDRFTQLSPKVLIAADGYAFGGRRHDRREVVAALKQALPSLQHLILARVAYPSEPLPAGCEDWTDALLDGAAPEYEQVGFDHPLWVLFSSGTTGVPKGIVHSHGGALMEHLKSGALCLDVGPEDRYFFYTSTGWVVWNLHVCALLAGVTVVLYDGSPNWPDPLGSLRVVETTGATIFGSGAAYLSGVRGTGRRPNEELDLSRLGHIISTGSPLPDVDWRWVYEAINPNLRLDSASGGTDIASAFVGGSPLLPVRTGLIPCRWLGCAVQAWDPEGKPLVGEVGELVVTEPMPSMPTFFWNDEDGTRYHDAYFGHYEGIWRHGDWIRINQDGTCVISGRSDSTLNRLGVRMGSADIYGIVEPIEGVADCVVLGVEQGEGGYWMPLFVVPSDGGEVSEELRARIVAAITDGLSRRHVPDEILTAPAVPRTLTGKKLEVPLKRLMQGEPLEKVANLGAVNDPDAVRWFATFAAERRRASV